MLQVGGEQKEKTNSESNTYRVGTPLKLIHSSGRSPQVNILDISKAEGLAVSRKRSVSHMAANPFS